MEPPPEPVPIYVTAAPTPTDKGVLALAMTAIFTALITVVSMAIALWYSDADVADMMDHAVDVGYSALLTLKVLLKME